MELRAVKTLETKMDKVLGGEGGVGFRQAKLAGYTGVRWSGYTGMERMDGLSHSTHKHGIVGLITALVSGPQRAARGAEVNKPGGHQDKGRRQTLRCKTVMSLTHAPAQAHHPSHPPAPPDGDCEACWSHSCRRSNTQVGCTSTLKAHQAQALLVGNTLFMTEPVEA